MNPVVIQVVGVLVILFFLFVLFMCSKSWRITHVLFAFFTFAAAIACSAYMSLSLKTNTTWKRLHGSWVRAVDVQEKLYLELQHGDLHEVIQSKPTIRGSREELSRIRFDRGRVHRGCKKLDNFTAQGVTLQVSTPPAAAPMDPAAAPADPAAAPPADPAAAPAAAPMDPAAAPAQPAAAPAEERVNGIKKKTVLYAFTEKESADTTYFVPDGFIGEFQAADSDPQAGTARLVPLVQLDPLQLQYGQENRTWVLYELMPLDGHEIFSDKDPDANNAYGEMREDVLRPLFEGRIRTPELLQQFLVDGQPMAAAAEKLPGFTMAPENTLVKVNFLKPFSVDVDSDVTQGANQAGYFDPSGRSMASSLRRLDGKPAEFIANDAGYFSQARADQLVSTDAVKKETEKFFSRKLIDFEYVFHDSDSRVKRLQNDIRLATRNRDLVVITRDNAEKQFQLRDLEKKKLVADLKFVSYERDQAAAYLQKMQGQHAAMKSQLALLYAQCKTMAAELKTLQLKMEADINSQLGSAAK